MSEPTIEESPRDFVVRTKFHCADSGVITGPPPASKTMKEVREHIAKVNQERGCEILTLLPAAKPRAR